MPTLFYITDGSFDTGIVVEKRSVRLKAFPWKDEIVYPYISVDTDTVLE